MRIARLSSLLLAAACAASSLPAAAQPSAPTLDEALNAIRAYAPQALREQGAPGMAVAITDRTHTLAIVTAGLADVASSTPVTADTRFPIGSITKSMTALTVLEQHDEGHIDLNAPVTRYLPFWKLPGGSGILVHQLLSHTGGVPDDYSATGSQGYDLAQLRYAHTIFAPGTSWSYANDGYGTLGVLLENVTGHSWSDDVQRGVLEPLGMNRTSTVFDNRTLGDAATGYIFRDGDRVAVPPHDPLIAAPPMDFVDAAGSVISGPEDMARYMRLYLNEGKTANGTQLIAPASFAAMTSPDRLANGKPAGSPVTLLAEWPGLFSRYGYGLAIQDTDGDRLVAHTGGISGYTSCMQMNLTRGFAVIALSNLVEAPLHPCQIVKYAMAVLRAQQLGQPIPPAPTGPPIPAPVVTVADYLGTYTTADGSSVRVAHDENGMYLMDRGTRYRLVAQGGDLFWTDDPKLTIYAVAFERNAAKHVDGFTDGALFYAGEGYTGARAFSHPAAWDGLIGRYENTTFGGTQVTRVVIVKGKLTLDGLEPLRALADGTFRQDTTSIRFDTPFDGKMQRLWLDGVQLYRVDLP
jgi:D-alanyl-D-alanine carboxypeptidase